MKSTFKSQACGKFILAGEHSVVYGGKAIGWPLKKLGMQMDWEVELVDSTPKYDIKLGTQQMNETLVPVLRDGMQSLDISQNYNISILGRSNLPFGAGLGSSASLSVAMIRGLQQIQKTENSSVAELANILERRFHGNPSGLDVSIIAAENPVIFSKIAGIQKLDYQPRNWKIIILDTGTRASTAAMVARAKPYFIEQQAGDLVEKFDAIIADILQALDKNEHHLLAKAMNANATLLNEVGVVDKLLWDFMRRLQSLGIMAVKPTGAGGGGCLLCLLDEQDTEEQFLALKKEFSKYHLWEVDI